jgi:hypothetical protein
MFTHTSKGGSGSCALWAPKQGLSYPLKYGSIQDLKMTKELIKSGTRKTPHVVDVALTRAATLPYGMYAFWIVGYFGVNAMEMFKWSKWNVAGLSSGNWTAGLVFGECLYCMHGWFQELLISLRGVPTIYLVEIRCADTTSLHIFFHTHQFNNPTHQSNYQFNSSCVDEATMKAGPWDIVNQRQINMSGAETEQEGTTSQHEPVPTQAAWQLAHYISPDMQLFKPHNCSESTKRRHKVQM